MISTSQYKISFFQHESTNITKKNPPKKNVYIIHNTCTQECLLSKGISKIFSTYFQYIGSPGSRNITHDGHFCCIWIEDHICFGKRLFFRINNRAIQMIKGRKVWLHQWLKSKHIFYIFIKIINVLRWKKTTRFYMSLCLFIYIAATMHKIWKKTFMNTTFIAALNRLFLFYLFVWINLFLYNLSKRKCLDHQFNSCHLNDFFSPTLFYLYTLYSVWILNNYSMINQPVVDYIKFAM